MSFVISPFLEIKGGIFLQGEIFVLWQDFQFLKSKDDEKLQQLLFQKVSEISIQFA